VLITIRAAGMLAFGDYHYIHFFNLLMRHCLGNLKLQLVSIYLLEAVTLTAKNF
jgi:hypothetical protein